MPSVVFLFRLLREGQIGRITLAGDVVEFPIRTAYAFPVGITLGPDGNL